MSSLRSTNYPANRPSIKPPDGFGKSMHGDSLKPGDVVYGPAVVENDRGEVGVLPKHFGVVVQSEASGVLVMYATSEKSYNIQHNQSFTAEDKSLSNGFSKDGHWSRTDFYVMPPELLERRGFVSDSTWDKVQAAATEASRGGNSVHMPSMERDGSLHNTRGRDAGEWSGMGAAMAQVAKERAELAGAGHGSAEAEALRDAKANAVSFVQELLKTDGEAPAHKYSANEAAQLADRIVDAPDGTMVVMTPQDKLRLVSDAAGLAKCDGWEKMSAADARELIDGEVSMARAAFAQEAPTKPEASVDAPQPAALQAERQEAAAERER